MGENVNVGGGGQNGELGIETVRFGRKGTEQRT